MIVRINQIDLSGAEQGADWPAAGLPGPVEFTWSQAARAFEVLVLEQDEKRQSLNETFRRSQMRLMIPQTIAALREPGEEIVLRLDGPLAPGELLGVMAHLTEPDLTGRFAFSDARKLDPAAKDAIGSVRVQPSPQNCSAICLNPAIGLDRSVRLRAYAIPESLVNPLLDINDASDERWREILPKAGFVLSTARGLRSLQIFSERFGPDEVKSRLMQRLMESAKSQSRAAG